MCVFVPTRPINGGTLERIGGPMEIVTGDAPQPGETPRDERNPWTFSDPDTAFWRGESDRAAEEAAEAGTAISRHPRPGAAAAAQSATLTPPTFLGDERHTGAAAEARAAGREDVVDQFSRGGRRPETVEQAHDKIDEQRFNPLSAYARTTPPGSESVPPRHSPQLPATPHEAATRREAATPHEAATRHEAATPCEAAALREAATRRAIEPSPSNEHPTEALVRPIARPDLDRRSLERRDPDRRSSAHLDPQRSGNPDRLGRRGPIEMPAKQDPRPLELPAGEKHEPKRDHPTVGIGRGQRPWPVPSGLSPLSRAAQRPPSPLLETSPFWLTDQQRAERAERFPEEQTRQQPAAAGTARRHRTPHRPVTGLAGLIALGLVAAFFSWVSAEPFWLAAGHGRPGVATVTQCTGSGVILRCTGRFQAADGRYPRSRVTLLGVASGQRSPGAVAPARMLNRTSGRAYVGESGPLVHLRWVLGFVLVLLCGLGIAALTGSRQLETVRARRAALALSFAGPLLLLLGFLAAAY
ncbi:MAG: hypothetical protein QOE51_4262 [Actinoplanes sp.]|nr:hypothetical protein [Actinoplanes sp.]